MIVKTFVVGAHGQIGQLLVHKLLDRGDTVTGGYRDPLTQTPDPEKNFRAVELNLAWPVSRLTELFTGHDAVIFAAGSRGKDLLGVDLDGAIKTMKAAEADDVGRFIMLSALDAEDPARWPDELHDYYIAKYYADEWLIHNTDLDYVIVQPTALTNDPAQGTITLKPQRPSTIPRADVADVLIAALDSNRHRETIKIASGKMPISEAVKS